MKYGFRTPSLNKRIAARTSVKRYFRHNMGIKAPRGMGWLTNPKKAAYNRVYNRTSFGIGGKGGEAALFFALIFGSAWLAFQFLKVSLKLAQHLFVCVFSFMRGFLNGLKGIELQTQNSEAPKHNDPQAAA